MRRVIVEDSTDGLRLCKIIAEIYSPDGEAISVESFHGMVNLKRKIEELCAELKPTDDAIIVYDGIKENPLVLRHAEEAFGYLEASGKEDRFRMLDTISFELEVLMTDGIEYFADLSEYGKYDEKMHKNIKYATAIGKWIPLKMLLFVYERICRSCSKYEGGKNFFVSNGFIFCVRQRHPKIWFEEGERVEIHGEYFLAPKMYHEELNFFYGDYMRLPPEANRKPDHVIE